MVQFLKGDNQYQKDVADYAIQSTMDAINSINMLNICAKLSNISAFEVMLDKRLGYLFDSDGNTPSMIFQQKQNFQGLKAIMNNLILGREDLLEKSSLDFGTTTNVTWI